MTLRPVRLVATTIVVATLVAVLALAGRQSMQTSASQPQETRRSRSAANPTSDQSDAPPDKGNAPPDKPDKADRGDAAEKADKAEKADRNDGPDKATVRENVGPQSWGSQAMQWLGSFQQEVELDRQQHPNGLSAANVGGWKDGDPWPGGYKCTSGQSDAFHMKPDKGCEPNCEQCQMVCIPSAFLGPFQNHGGELGGNCFERGCLQPAGEGKQSGVTFYMYDCDLALQKKWATLSSMTSESAKKNLDQCLAECKKKDKGCELKCQTTHKEEVAMLAISKRAASGFAGEHGDAYETGTVMGAMLLIAIVIGVAGCFVIHTHHSAKKPAADKLGPKGALAPNSDKSMSVHIEGKVIQVATSSDGQLAALTEDGRVFTWSADDAGKARESLDASLVAALPAQSKPQSKAAEQTLPLQPAKQSVLSLAAEVAASAPIATQPATALSPARAPRPVEKLESPPAARPPSTRTKASISELKKSVNVIRAVS